ncbi:MAG TPA: hypothetical protein GX743_08135 [Actinomycetales bacterium]|nr:hypothetical protein [Actinomycetales bacterium]
MLAAIVFSDGEWGLGSFFLLVGVVAAAVASFVVRGALGDGWVMVGPEGISLGKVRLRWGEIAGGRGRRAV